MEKGFQELRVESKAGIEQLRTELARELRHLSNSLDVMPQRLCGELQQTSA